MKKEGILVISFVVMIVLGFSFVSASWLGDAWGKITGRAVITINAGSTGDNIAYSDTVKCSDTDGGIFSYSRGIVTASKKKYNDTCYSTNILTENYCTSKGKKTSLRIVCPRGCYNGECINDSSTLPIIVQDFGIWKYLLVGSLENNLNAFIKTKCISSLDISDSGIYTCAINQETVGSAFYVYRSPNSWLYVSIHEYDRELKSSEVFNISIHNAGVMCSNGCEKSFQNGTLILKGSKREIYPGSKLPQGIPIIAMWYHKDKLITISTFEYLYWNSRNVMTSNKESYDAVIAAYLEKYPSQLTNIENLPNKGF